MRRGLTFGKYLPLHRGHQHVIDTAFAECDDVTIVVYDSMPEVADALRMPVHKRAGWLRAMFPQAQSIVPVPDPGDGAGDSPELAPLYAEQLAFLGRFDRVYTSEPAYETFAQLLGAEHRVVDVARALVPISGTRLRTDLYAGRGYIDPAVYASLVQKVVLVGTESSGKTTLARALAERFGTRWVHEFGRELWEAQGLTGTFADHWEIAQRQRLREEAAARQAREHVFCDTNAFTTLMWSLRSFGTADERLFELVEHTRDDYVWLLCANDFGWVQDGTRELVDGEAEAFQELNAEWLAKLSIPYVTVRGPLERRIDEVGELLRAARPTPP